MILRHTTFITHYSYIGMLYSSYVHLLKVVFGVESTCEIYLYTLASPVPVAKKSKHTVNKKLNICQMDKTVKIQCVYIGKT